MSHLFRFIGTQHSATSWSLEGDEAHHFNKVLRLSEGARVEVTDGCGRWAEGVVSTVEARSVHVSVGNTQVSDPVRLRLEIALGALRPGAIDEILPMLCELGVDRLHVFGQVGVAKARLGEKVVDRWHRILTQSIKQCKRPWLPDVREHASVAEMLAATKGAETHRFCLHPEGATNLPAALNLATGGTVLAMVGGEKGFDPSEEQMIADAGIARVTLGTGILRAVTAAVATAAVLSVHREQL